MTVSSSPRLGLTRWSSADDPFSRGQLDGDHADLDNLVAIDLQVASLNARPAAAIRGRFCTVDDGSTTPRTYRDTGTRWVEVNLPTYGGTPTAETFGKAGAAGTSTTVARGDHVHAMPVDPIPAHVAATDPHPQYLIESDTGWVTDTGFGAKSGFTTSGSGYKNRNGTVTAHLRFTRSGGDITAASNGNVGDLPAMTVPTAIRTGWNISGQSGSVVIPGGASYGFLFNLAADGTVYVTSSLNPGVTWPKTAAFAATLTYNL